MKRIVQFCIFGGVTLYNLLRFTPVYGQIVPDTTLPNNSIIVNQDNITTITGGAEAGTNLFHSFEQFSVPTNGTAYFNNNLNTQNIFSRVTGSSISNIDGLVKANGTANLFLLNSNGIIFGPNASLDLGGSFLSTTANNVLFSDGRQFATTDSSTTPLLTVSVPIGLSFSNKSGDINIIGSGNNVIAGNFQPIVSNNNPSVGLKVQPQRTLAIVGGNVSIQGGILGSQGGRIELGSVNSGIVSLIPNSYGWALGYEGVDSFKDIQLSQRTLVDASGFESGSIQVQAKDLQLNNSSLLLIQSQGTIPGNSISVNASESIVIQNLVPVGVASGIWSENLGFGNGADIVVSTPNLTLQSNGQIFTSTFGNASAGNIILAVPESLQIIGLLPGQEGNGVVVGSFTVGDGRSGDIKISVGRLNIANGGVLITSNLTPIESNNIIEGSGNINIDATDLVEVDGTTTNLFIPSAISTATFSSEKAGNVVINTRALRVTNGGRIDSSTGASGSAGSVTINATDLIEVRGAVLDFLNPSLIISSANIVEPSLQRLLRIPTNS